MLKSIVEIEWTFPVLNSLATGHRIRFEGEQVWRRVLAKRGTYYVNIKRKPVTIVDSRLPPLG